MVVVEASVDVLFKNFLNFNVDNVRMMKILGSFLFDCIVV